MKIMILSGLYPPQSKGGAEKVASLLVTELIALGHTVIVVTTGKRSSLENNGTVHVLSPRNIFWYGEIARFSFAIRAVWHVIDMFNILQAFSVRRLIKEEQPDVVWSHNLKGLGFLIPRLLNILRLPHIHTVHDIQLVKPSGVSGRGVISFGFYARLMRYLFGSPDVVTSPSKWLLSLYQNFNFFSRSASYVLPHVFGGTKNDEPRKKQENKILYLGQLEATKGVPFLIETLSTGVKDLVMVGDGLLKNYCQKSGVDFRGYLSGEVLERVFGETDFLIVPSLIIENSPTVILEAFSHGMPVIASNIGGIPELVVNGENGFLFEPGNSQSLNEAIQKVKAADYAALSQKARERHQVLQNEHQKVMGEIISLLS